MLVCGLVSFNHPESAIQWVVNLVQFIYNGNLVLTTIKNHDVLEERVPLVLMPEECDVKITMLSNLGVPQNGLG